MGYYTSIALDSNNKVHISYYDSSNYDLKYATNASGSWVIFTIDSTGDVGSYTSIALDSNNKVHISYYDDTNSYLKYVTNASGEWVTYIIDDSPLYGFSGTSMAIDSNNKAHIGYFELYSDLKYATNSSGSWVTDIIEYGSTADGVSIAIDSNNKVHIGYFDSSYGDLKYATQTSQYTLTVSKSGTGSGAVTSSDGGIICGPDCTETYDSGTSVTLTATADTGSTFTGWTGDADCLDGQVTMDSGKTCTATFELIPDIDVQPESWDYGSVNVGSTSDKSFTVQNTGTATLNVSGTTLVGTDAGQFAILSGGGAFSLAPGTSRTVTVRFAPTSAGAKSATLRFTSDDPDENLKDVPLSGTGVETCPATAALEGTPQQEAKLGVLYAFRDKVLANTPMGQRYITLFYKHAVKGVWLMVRHPDLRARTRALLERYLPTLQAILAGRPATMTHADLAAIKALLQAFAAKASPQLQADLKAMQEELQQGAVLEQLGIRIQARRLTPRR